MFPSWVDPPGIVKKQTLMQTYSHFFYQNSIICAPTKQQTGPCQTVNKNLLITKMPVDIGDKLESPHC